MLWRGNLPWAWLTHLWWINWTAQWFLWRPNRHTSQNTRVSTFLFWIHIQEQQEGRCGQHLEITQVFFFSVVLSTWVLLKNFHVCTWEFQDFTLTRHVEMFALTSGSAWGHNLSLKAQPQDVLGATDIYDWVHISNHLLQQPERDTGKHWGTSLLSLSDSIQVATVQLRKKPELPLVQQWEPLICVFLLLPPDVSYNHSKKHHGNRGKVTGAKLAGRSRDQHRTESS